MNETPLTKLNNCIDNAIDEELQKYEAERKSRGFTKSQFNKFKKAEWILKKFSESGIKTPVSKDNSENLDTQAFLEMPEVKEVIKQLQDAGIKDSSELGDLGFVPACLIIRFGFKKE